MKIAASTVLVNALAVQAVRIVQSNDDGWAELNIRALNDALIAGGHQVLLSGPAEDKSGSCMWRPQSPCYTAVY